MRGNPLGALLDIQRRMGRADPVGAAVRGVRFAAAFAFGSFAAQAKFVKRWSGAHEPPVVSVLFRVADVETPLEGAPIR